MSPYICPSCGKRYNGVRCSNCLYENFSEEYRHGGHTHKGEPLVIRGKQRRPIPRKDPFECEEKTRKPRLRPLVLVLVILAFIWTVSGVVIGIVSEIADSVSDAYSSSKTADAVMPESGMTLYDDGQLRIVADWDPSRKYNDDLRVVVENQTRQDLTVTARDVLVNEYLLNYSSLYIPTKAGHTSEGWLYLDSTDLEDAGIEDVQWLTASFEAYDSDSYETVMVTDYIPLCVSSVLTQASADQGEVLYDQDGIRIVCKGYAPSSYDPEEFSEGDLVFYLENGTDAAVEIYTQDVTVNAQETYLSLWRSLPPHTQAVRRMSLFGLSSEELNIQTQEDVTEITASFQLLPDDGTGVTLTTGTLSLPFQLDYVK